jgi:hypothetical protein
MDFRASISRSAWAAPASNAARAAVVESWLGQIAASDISSATMTRTVAGRAPRARPRARLAGSRRARWDPRRSRRRGRPRNRPCTGRPATTPEPRTAHAIFRLIASVSSGEPQTPGADDEQERRSRPLLSHRTRSVGRLARMVAHCSVGRRTKVKWSCWLGPFGERVVSGAGDDESKRRLGPVGLPRDLLF